MSHPNDLSVEEKQVYDAKVNDVPSDGESSIDTIAALVNEGKPSVLSIHSPDPQADLTTHRSRP
jgi:hypothetical protein